MHRRRARSFLAPIHHPPSEIVASIFDYAAGTVNSSTAEPSYRRLLLISAVLTSWRHRPLKFPSLWRRISPRTPLPISTLFGGSSIRIDIQHAITGDAGLDAQHLAIFSPHSNRCRSLRIDGVEISTVEAAMQVPALAFEVLHLRSGVIFSGRLPAPRNLPLDGVHILPASPLYQKLVTLEMSNIRFRQPYAIRDFLHALAASPSLEELGARYLTFVVQPPRPMGSERGSAWSNLYILSHISASPSLCLKVHSRAFNHRRLDTVVPAAAPSLQTFSCICRLRFMMEGAAETESTLHVIGHNSEHCFNEKYPMPLLRVVELLSLSDTDAIVPLTKFLACHPLLAHIAFCGCPATFVELLVVSSKHSLCPHLDRLLVNCCPITPRDLLKVVKSRTARGEVSVSPMRVLLVTPPFSTTSEGKSELEGLLAIYYL
ncbi:hypothetical protein BOTBODRAFT_645886 [Botryobasidium botryosum FD-172 SS1]|uniref:F-box domain-containing protein n=1 Tax=Botryobasidium botryosum (strain FD-172 SS1) TaxID=930990 RepID=A0A067M151_BOTB1|nr:hypothetical protein BOTBODRAFT_645886 [Botryobasidium botryosum FD-172 SS1]